MALMLDFFLFGVTLRIWLLLLIFLLLGYLLPFLGRVCIL